MRNVRLIALRELQSYFVSPLAYIILMMFMFIVGWFFLGVLFAYSEYSMQAAMNPGMAEHLTVHDVIIRTLFSTFGVILIFLAPLLSMRVFADEKRQGTAELMLTAPVSTVQLVLGKYFGTLGFGAVLLGSTLAFPAYLLAIGAPVDAGPLAAVYLGTFLMLGAFLSVGVFSSALTANPVASAGIAFVTCLFFWVVGFLGDIGGGAGEYGRFLKSLSITERYEDFLKGVVDTGAVVYYLTFIAFGLFLTGRVIDSSRWR
ncbi:MAG TPA: ABC transporter permease [Candidatus Polarisedimenticolia bacterium]|nr:ABC transporter permease [Candidatus Polarisedimenticolia bacterium]